MMTTLKHDLKFNCEATHMVISAGRALGKKVNSENWLGLTKVDLRI